MMRATDGRPYGWYAFSPSPVGEGGPLAVDEVSTRKAKRTVGDADPYKVGAPFRLPQWGKAWIARWETDSAILGFPWGKLARERLMRD